MKVACAQCGVVVASGPNEESVLAAAARHREKKHPAPQVKK